MKRIISMLIAVILCLALSMSVCATEFTNPPIVDNAGILSAEEFEELSARLDRIRNEYNMDVAVYTEETMSGFDAESSADDIFDYNGYGAGVNDDGIIFYICSGDRKYHLSTHAEAIEVFHDSNLAYMESCFVSYLSSDNWYSAIEEYADVAEDILWDYANGVGTVEKEGNPLFIIIAALIIPLIIALIMMNGKLKKMKTAVSDNYAANYMKEGSKNITVSRDIFLYSNIIRTEKPKNNTSSTHTSSSGRTHGGSGGSF